MALLPSEFLGSWKYERHEGFDKYLEDCGVPWLIRKATLMAGSSLEIAHLGGGQYQIKNKFASETNTYEFFLDREFESKGMDKCLSKVIVHFENGVISESRRNLDKPDLPSSLFSFHVSGSTLTLETQTGSSSCKRFFKRV